MFVNVFGGITACDAVANGIVEALEMLESTRRSKPLVVRLDGNNVTRAGGSWTRRTTRWSTQADTMDDAADKAAELLRS